MARISLFLLVVACLGTLQGAWGKRRLYRKARYMDTTTCVTYGGVLFNDVCYIIGGFRGTWKEGRETCQAYEGDLAVISKKAAYDYITEMLDLQLTNGSAAWIGLSDIATEGLFEWVDGEVHYEEGVDYWDIFWEWSPDSAGGFPNKDCCLIDKNTGKVEERNCNEQHMYICEINTTPNEWELEQLNAEIEWENNLVETLSNSSVMKAMEEYNGDDLYQFDIKLDKEQEEIFKSGGDPSSATGAFAFKGRKPNKDELAKIKNMIDEHGKDSWDPATREFESRKKRSALGFENGFEVKIWPGAIVPYEYNSSYPEEGKPYVQKAMAIIQENTCVRFKPRTDEERYMTINNAFPRSCFSQGIGYPWYWSDTIRYMNFGWCWNSVDSIIHELFHALGFWHEMSRPDRDDYIELVFQNIKPDRTTRWQFVKHEKSTFSGYPYDYFSIMHYHLNADAIDPSKYTMRPKKLKEIKLYEKVGRAKMPTKFDWYEMNTLYMCDPKYIQMISDREDVGDITDESTFDSCTVSCGIGERTRHFKRCIVNGRGCRNFRERVFCYMPPCPKPGEEIPTDSSASESGEQIVALDYTWGGCWVDDRFPSTLPSLEGKSTILSDDYLKRTDKIQKCANAAKEAGSDTFALKLGGKCLVVPLDAIDQNIYKANGPSKDCEGLGAVSSIDVYHLDTDVQGEWGVWSAYESCSKTCGSGLQTRTRECNNPKPKGSGDECTGNKSGTGTCATEKCPVDGGWGVWTAWTTDTCPDFGYKYRQRKCDNPRPQNGGAQCLSYVNFVDIANCY